MPRPLPRLAVCVDFGSTFTKAALIDVAGARLVATSQHPTSLATDVLDAYDACLADLIAEHPDAAQATTLACSSAGGGLRIAVVGNEELVTAEAGRRVALSSGGKVVLVLAGGLDAGKLVELRDAEPDVLLLVGGTDGGNSESLVADADVLSRVLWTGPVVVAGDVDAQSAVAAELEGSQTPYVLADNVVPRIGVLAPASAREAIREVFLAHVIGGKDLSRRPEFVEMVLGATPDVVLVGVELLAGARGGTAPGTGVVVVDIGGATTDVHSVVVPDPEEATLSREVVATSPVTRTVEGDLGMRWSALTTVEAAIAAGLESEELRPAAVRRTADPGLLPATAADRAADLRLAAAASVLAMRRHAGRSQVVLSPAGRVVERSGKDLRAVDLLIGSGGVLRAATAEEVRAVFAPATGTQPDAWQFPERPAVDVDTHSILAAAGLIALYGGDAAAHEAARSLIWNTVSAMSNEVST
ncbi:MAG: glutamate mutase [Marmoricola sp.]|nr:glutamate mutase [Marmoricola sp.]